MPELVIVDDDATFVETLAPFFAGEGYAVVTEFTLAAAHRYLSSHTPDALITDLQLGEADGWELVTFARRHQPELPVIVVTGFPTNGTDAAARRLKVPIFLKPFDPDQLVDYVRYRVPAHPGHTGIEPAEVVSSVVGGRGVDFYADVNEPRECEAESVYTQGSQQLLVRRWRAGVQLTWSQASARRQQRTVALAGAEDVDAFWAALTQYLQDSGWQRI